MTLHAPAHAAKSSPSRGLPFWLCLAAFVGIFTYFLIYHYHHETRENGKHLGDFLTFYQAAQIALAHGDIYTAGLNPKQMYVYPPLVAFLYTPLTHLAKLQAAHVSLVLNTLLLAGSVLLGAKAMLQRFGTEKTGVIAVALLVSILSENEMREQLTMLETDALMLMMFTLALWWLDRRPILAGVALALALNIKYLPIIVLPWLILRRRWTAIAGLAGGAIFFALIPAVLLGWHEDIRCLHVALGGLLTWLGVAPTPGHAIVVHNIGDTLSLSITSALGRILGRRGFSNPAIMAAAAGIGVVSLAIVAAIYRANRLPLWIWPAPRKQTAQPFDAMVALEWAGLITVALVFSPDTNSRHLVLAVLVNTAVAVLLLSPRQGVSRVPAIIAAALIFLGSIMPFRSLGPAYYHFGVPCICLLIGYFLIVGTGLKFIAAGRRDV